MAEHPEPGRTGRRLESWKEIAEYLRRDIRTVQRWEKEGGLPVHRLHHKRRGTPYCYTDQLDTWMEARSSGNPNGSVSTSSDTNPPRRGRVGGRTVALVGLVLVVAVVVGSRSLLRFEVEFHDDFRSVPQLRGNPEYEVFYPEPSLWKPDTLAGSLTLWTHQGDTWNENKSGMKVRNLVGHPYEGKRFQATTRLHGFWPRHDWQQAGLFVFADEDNYVRFTVVSSFVTVGDSLEQVHRLQCVYERDDEVLHMRSMTLKGNLRGVPDVDRPKRASDGPVDIWLRVTRDNDNWTLRYSDDGLAFFKFDENEFALETSYVGLAAFHGIGHRDKRDLTWGPIPAHFDFLDIAPIP